MKRNLVLLFALCSALSLKAQTTVEYNVILRSNATTTTMWDGNVLTAYGMAPDLSTMATVPAFTIHCFEGDTVVITARNVSQGDHHTVHLHGLDVDTRNDGDPMTSFWLEHMQDTTYTFVAAHAGTYFYHCHVGDVLHVQMGMYGLVIVHAAGGANTAWTGGPMFNKEYAWLTSEMDEYWHDSIPEHDPLTDTLHIPPYEPDYFLVNGKSETQLAGDTSIAIVGQVNEKIYVRLANIGFNDNVFVFPSSLNAKVIDSDGRPLPSQFDLDTIVVSPGERFGVMLTPSAETVTSVAVHYIDMNTGLDLSVQQVPVTIDGFINVESVSSGDYLTVFPQPASDKATIAWYGESFKPNAVVCRNALGQTIMDFTPDSDQNYLLIDISTLPVGVYLITASDGTRNVSRRLLVD